MNELKMTGGLITSCPSPYGPSFEPGDRLVIKEGYENAGEICFYVGKSVYDRDHLMVHYDDPEDSYSVLIEAVERKPYTPKERAERAVDARWTCGPASRALLVDAIAAEIERGDR